MANAKQGVITVGDVDFRWSVYRQPTWATGRHEQIGLLGLAILVEPLAPSRRELLLEFSIDRTRHGDMPQHQRFHLPDGRLSEAIQEALHAGYDSTTRGKRFIHEAGTLQPR